MSARPTSPTFYRWDGAALVLKLRVQPRAKDDALAGLHGGRLKVRITAPPVDGKANAQLCALLAEVCGVPSGQVSVEQGSSGRDKTLRIERPRKLPAGVAR